MLIITVTVILAAFVGTLVSSNRPALGLDLQGGVSVVLFPVKGSDVSTLNTAVSIIRNRVDALGIAEPDVSRQGNTIVIDLPGAKNRTQALNVIGRTAELRFRLVQNVIPPSGVPNTTTTKPGATTTTKPGATTTTKPAATTTTAANATTTTKGNGAGVPGHTINTALAASHRPAQTATTTPATTPTPAPTTAKPATAATPTTTAPVNSAAGKTCKELQTPPSKDFSNQPVILPGRDQREGCYVLGPALLTGKSI